MTSTTEPRVERTLLYDEPSTHGYTHNVDYQAVYRLAYVKPDWTGAAHPLASAQTVRVLIHVDGYDYQSYARAELFDFPTHQWNVVAHIAAQHVQSPRNLSDPRARHFAADVTTLLSRVEQTIGWKGKGG